MESKLMPCPFCGYDKPKMTEKRSGNYSRHGDMYQILCGRCKARGPIFTAKYRHGLQRYGAQEYEVGFDKATIQQKAIDNWNRRSADDHK